MRKLKVKQGPWTYEEHAFVKENAGKLPPEEIAKQINRHLGGVRSYMNKQGLMKYYTAAQINQDKDDCLTNIKKTQYWRELCSQFSEIELESFQYHWTHTIKQFREDILHTEELQIVDMIKLEVLMNRLLTQQMEIKTKIADMDRAIQAEKKIEKENRDIDMIRNYEIQIASLYAATESISKEHRELLKEKTNMFKGLKATREQRIKQVENSKESFSGWYKMLIAEPKKRQSIGAYIEKMRLATEVEYERLSELYKYADGMIDKPLLVAKKDEKPS